MFALPPPLLKRRFPFKLHGADGPQYKSWANTWSQHIPSAGSCLFIHADYPVYTPSTFNLLHVLSKKQCSAHTHTRQRATLIIQWALTFFLFTPSLGLAENLKKTQKAWTFLCLGIQGQVIAVRIPGWLERTCKILAASQEAVLEAGLDICYKPHFHPHIHRTLHESISITGGGARVKNRGRKGGVVVHCNAGLAKSKKRSEERASVRRH